MGSAGLARRGRRLDNGTLSESSSTERRKPRFQELLELLPHIVWRVLPDGTTEYANPAAIEFSGLSVEEAARLAAGPLHPNDREKVLDAQARALRENTDFELECRLRQADGQYRWMLLRGRPLPPAGEGLPTILGTSTDIHELKRSATLLDTLFSTTPAGLGFVDCDYRFVRVNQTLAEIDGIPVEEHPGRRVADVVPSLWDQLEPIYRGVIERGESFLNLEIAGETRATPGEIREWLVSYSPVRLEGELLGVGVMALDVTERKRAEAELAAAAEERRELITALLSAQETERRRIAADIHGDTLQVLAAVSLRLGQLKDALADETDRAEVVEFEQACHDAQSRLRSLLFELWPPSLDRAGLPQAVAELLAQLEADTDATCHLRVEPSPDLPVELRGMLFRIVSEALTNVRRHARAQTVRVELFERESRYVVRIADDGSGFDPDRAARRGHLGLLEMRERAETAGGALSITSTRGEGTTVEVSIPLAAATHARN